MGRPYDDEGKKYHIHHVDDMPGDSWLDKVVFDPTVSFERPDGDHLKCEHNHSPDTCRCHMRCEHVGQDESIYRAGVIPAKGWHVDSKGVKKSKSEGKGVMVSAFMQLSRKFGAKLSPDERATINAYRETRGKPPLSPDYNPFCHYFEYGKNADGYWTGEKMKAQTDDFLDAAEALFPDTQFAIEYDASSGHLYMGDGALVVGNMNLKWGGVSAGVLRNTLIVDGCVGDKDAIIYFNKDSGKWSLTQRNPNDVKVDCKVKVGEEQSMSFGEACDTDAAYPTPPPFYHLDALCYDIMMTDAQLHAHNESLVAEGKNTVESARHREGFLGSPKGLKQVLWERGLWDDRMIAKVKEGDRRGRAVGGPECASSVLAACPDFANERGQLRKLIEERGHIMIESPIAHPEIAGMFPWPHWY